MDNPTWSVDKVIFDVLHFQRGSVDEFTFEGPDLGKIVAVWIGVESGLLLDGQDMFCFIH